MKPLTDYAQKAINDLDYAQKQAAAAKPVVSMVDKIFASGWPEDWIYRLIYGPDNVWLTLIKQGDAPTDQEVREIKKCIMKYTTTVTRKFYKETGRFCWVGVLTIDSFLIEFEFFVDSDPNCEIRAVEKMVTVFESVCDDEEPTDAQNPV